MDRPAVPDRFALEHPLGSGGMGSVWAATERDTGRRVALKVVRQADPALIYRLKREFRAARALRHPHLVALYALDLTRWPCFSMERVDGVDFLRWVRPDGHLRVGRLRRALPQLAGALGAMHGVGLVHRDVKPGNVLVTAAGRVVLLDLGLATGWGADASAVRAVAGTCSYMSPEQACAAPADAAFDAYGVGVLLYEALCGRRPYQGSLSLQTRLKQRVDAPDPRAIDPRAPDDLAAWCLGLLRRDPRQRLRLAGLADPQPPLPAGCVGREAVFRQLDAPPQPRVRWLVGPPGIGRTTALDTWLQDRRARGDQRIVLRAACGPGERLPWAGVDGIVDGVARRLLAGRPRDLALGGLARAFPAFRDLAPPRRAPFEPGLRRALAAAAPHGAILAVDDLDRAGAAARRVLARLATLPGVQVVGTARAAPDGVDRVDVPPLTPADVARLAQRVEPPGPAALWWWAAGGVPRLLVEMARRRTLDPADALVGDLPGGAEALRRIAVLGPLPSGVAAAIVGPASLGALQDRSLVDDGPLCALADAALARRIRGGVCERVARRWHRRAAQAVGHGDALEVARQLAGAGDARGAGQLLRLHPAPRWQALADALVGVSPEARPATAR